MRHRTVAISMLPVIVLAAAPTETWNAEEVGLLSSIYGEIPQSILTGLESAVPLSFVDAVLNPASSAEAVSKGWATPEAWQNNFPSSLADWIFSKDSSFLSSVGYYTSASTTSSETGTAHATTEATPEVTAHPKTTASSGAAHSTSAPPATSTTATGGAYVVTSGVTTNAATALCLLSLVLAL